MNNNKSLHLYSTFFCTQSALNGRGESPQHHQCAVQHPPGWCDSSRIAPEHPPHTRLANQYMGMIRRPFWWIKANGQIWTGCQG